MQNLFFICNLKSQSQSLLRSLPLHPVLSLTHPRLIPPPPSLHLCLSVSLSVRERDRELFAGLDLAAHTGTHALCFCCFSRLRCQAVSLCHHVQNQGSRASPWLPKNERLRRRAVCVCRDKEHIHIT